MAVLVLAGVLIALSATGPLPEPESVSASSTSGASRKSPVTDGTQDFDVKKLMEGGGSSDDFRRPNRIDFGESVRKSVGTHAIGDGWHIRITGKESGVIEARCLLDTGWLPEDQRLWNSTAESGAAPSGQAHGVRPFRQLFPMGIASTIEMGVAGDSPQVVEWLVGDQCIHLHIGTSGNDIFTRNPKSTKNLFLSVGGYDRYLAAKSGIPGVECPFRSDRIIDGRGRFGKVPAMGIEAVSGSTDTAGSVGNSHTSQSARIDQNPNRDAISGAGAPGAPADRPSVEIGGK